MNTSHLTSPALLHISHHIMNAYTHAFVVAYFDGLLPPSSKHIFFVHYRNLLWDLTNFFTLGIFALDQEVSVNMFSGGGRVTARALD